MKNPHMYHHILIVSAVYNELSSILDRLESPAALSAGGRKIICGRLEGESVRILITGPGIINTVQSLTAAVENLRPSIIIQTGCAGAFKESGLEVGDIGIATEEIDVQLGIELETGNYPLGELPFSLIVHQDLDLKNRYPLNRKLVDSALDILEDTLENNNTRIKKGPFITVSTITSTEKRARDLYRHFKPCMEQMEGCGAALLSIHYGILFLEIRSASNMVGRRNVAAWNFNLAFERGTAAVLAIIRNIKMLRSK